MPTHNLETLLPELQRIAEADIREPDLPMAVALQEANDLAALILQDVRAALLAVGLAPAKVDALAPAVDATRTAQSSWVVARDRSKDDRQRGREEAAYALRSELLAACRWNLRGDAVALATVDAIAEGDGLEDLIQDLRDLAHLLETRAGSFAADRTINVADATSSARRLAGEVEQGLSAARLTTAQAEVKGVRDRAYTYLAGLVAEIREAGRYAFRADPALRQKFASAYQRRKRHRAARGAAGAPEGTTSAPADPTTT